MSTPTTDKNAKVFVGAGILLVVGVGILFLLGWSVASQPASSGNPGEPVDLSGLGSTDPLVTVTGRVQEAPSVLASSPSQGPDSAPIVIHEFANFTCAHCAALAENLTALAAAYPNSVRIIWRDLFDSSSTYALEAAEAARCAAAQNTFWQFHDRLFEDQLLLSREKYVAIAAELGLNETTFSACLDAPTDQEALITIDLLEARNLNLAATPYLFINDTEIEGAPSYDELVAAVEAELGSGSQ